MSARAPINAQGYRYAKYAYLIPACLYSFQTNRFRQNIEIKNYKPYYDGWSCISDKLFQ